jgi:hypothetical protein
MSTEHDDATDRRLNALEAHGGNEVHLSDAQIEMIADRAADRALEKVYADIGKNALRKLTWLVGIVVVSLAMWLAGKGALQP